MKLFKLPILGTFIKSSLKFFTLIFFTPSQYPRINLEDDYNTAKELFGKLDLKFAPIYMTPLVLEYRLDKQEGFMAQKNNIKYYSCICLEFLKSQNLTNEKVKDLYKKHKK